MVRCYANVRKAMDLLSFAVRPCVRKCAEGESPTMQRAVRRVLGTLVLIVAAGPAGAQTITSPLSISAIRTGWNVDSFALEAPPPLVKTAGCPAADGYL